jgi:hypothetical protein
MTGFVFQDKYLDRLAKLSDQEVGRLVRALAIYHATGEEQELKGRECGYYDFIKGDIDEIENRYAARCETNRNNRQRSSTIDNDCQPSSTNDPKIKYKYKYNNYEDEEEEEDNNKRVRDAWSAAFGTKPSPAAIDRLLASDVDVKLIEKAIRISAVKSPKSPVDFVLTVLRDWKAEHLTIDDVDEYLMINDAVNGRIAFMTRDDALDELQKFRQRKKAAS